MAARERELRGENLEQTLARKGLVSDSQIAVAKAAQWGCPVFGQDQPIVGVQAPIPLQLLRECSAMPLHYSLAAKRLLIGFAQQIEHSLLHSLEEITGVRPEPCFVTRSQLDEQLGRLNPPSEWEEIVSEDEQTPRQMANTTGRLAIEVRAHTARSTRCREFIWTRLEGTRRVVDLLYRLKRSRPTMSSGWLGALEETGSSLG